MIFTLSTKLIFIRNTRILFPQGWAPRKSILKIVTEYFVVYPVELQGINKMLICPILSRYFSGSWSWREYQCHNDHALVVCDHVDGGIRLSGFVLSGFIAIENVDLPYFDGPWMDYQCHSEWTSNQLHYQFGVKLLGLGPFDLPGFSTSTSNAKFCSELIMATV